MSDPRCKCSLSISVNGDGCRYCQPQEYIDRMGEWLDEARKEAEHALAWVAETKEEWFARGAAGTLAMIDPKSTEYHEAVCQHGGYWGLIQHADEHDRTHLLEAAEHHEGKLNAQRLRQQADEAEK